MKRYLLTCLLATAFAATGCSDDEGPGPAKGPKPVWESFSHAQLLKFRGVVKHVLRTQAIASEIQSTLIAEFDPKGNCTAYNATGIETDASFLSKTRGDWGVEAAWYTYSYDLSGRMTTATKYEVGSDPKVFTITYGPHGTYTPAPFPLGAIEPFMLQGVTRIETDDYVLTSDGATATATQTIGGWRPTVEKTFFTFNDGFPAKEIVATYPQGSDEEIERSETTYTYDRKWLITTDEVKSYPGDDQSENQRIVVRFSREWPCTEISKEGYVGTESTPEFRLQYTYAENGLPLSAAYTTGMFYDSEFTQHYTAYDDAGNWTAGMRTEGGEVMTTKQSLTYF